MPRVLCLNGPNLNLLGRRQPDVYGRGTLGDLEAAVQRWGEALGLEIECLQSNDEAELIEALHRAREDAGVIFNPGAFTHTSAALGDAVAASSAPVVEVHLSNVRARDRWRKRSFIAPHAAATIAGRGVEGYRAGLRHLVNRRAHPFQTVRYGPHPDQVFDLRLGEGPTGVVLVHGGFWLDVWGRDTTESWAVDLAARGVPTANLEYRRLGSGGGATPTVSDVSRSLAAAIGALGTERTVVIGHSTGAHLGLAALGNGSAGVDMVVAVSGVLDLEEAAAAGRAEGAVDRFDPRRRTALLAAPPPSAPVVLVHGLDDTEVPAAHTDHYARHLRRQGASPHVVMVEGAGHFDALDPSKRLWESVRQELPLP